MRFIEAFQDGNQVVVAFKGTDNLPNLVADASWPIFVQDPATGAAPTAPNSTLTTYVSQAATFLAQVKAKYQNANITLTGHSLGGAIAQLLSDASGLPASVFNAPGAKQFEQALSLALAPAAALNPGPVQPNDTNYRVRGDQVSLAGTPIGQTVVLSSPYPDVWSAALGNYYMATVLQSLGSVSTLPPNSPLPLSSLLIPGLPNSSGAQTLAPIPVTAGQQDSFDPAGASTFVVTEAAGSPPLASISLPVENGVASYNLIFLTGASQSGPHSVPPGTDVTMLAGATGFRFTALDAQGHPYLLPDGGIVGLTFAASGNFGATITPDTSDGAKMHFAFADTASNTSGADNGQAYSGPVQGLQWQYLWTSQDGVNITASTPNVFIRGGPGEDALAAQGGSNVLDGGTGSNFLVGASGAGGGTDTFFTDARNNDTVWNTLVNFHAGDNATLWGFVPGTSSWSWDGISGAAGYTGATLRADVHGTGTTDANITFAGLTMAQAQKLQVSTGTVGGIPYLYFHNPGV